MMDKINQIFKTGIFILAVTVFGLTPAVQALADGKYNKHRSHIGYSNHNKSHHYNKHRNWRDSYRRNHRYGHSRRDHYRHSNHRGGEIVLGILTGGLLFHAMTNNQRGRNHDRTVYVQQQPVYAQPQQQQWTRKQQVQRQNTPQNTHNSCLQKREYQTTITVGGQSVPAYGQSCLQPDGSWKLGPAIPEPGY